MKARATGKTIETILTEARFQSSDTPHDLTTTPSATEIEFYNIHSGDNTTSLKNK